MKPMKATAQDIMTSDLMTVTPATTLTQFARILTEDNISGCPVVTVDGRLVGIVSKTDLLARLIEGRHDFAASPDFSGLLGLGEDGLVRHGRIGAGIRGGDLRDGRGHHGVEPADRPSRDAHPRGREASRREPRLHRLLVVEKGKLLGIITSLDVIAHFASGGE